MTYDPYDMIQKLLEAMDEAGLAPAPGTSIIPDGNVNRYQIHGDKPRTRNGAYQVFMDDHPAAWFMNWKEGKESKHTVSLHSSRESFSPEQKRQMREEFARAKAEREEEQKNLQLTAAEEARRIWEKATPVQSQQEHEYLVSKNIPPGKLRRQGDMLLVPLHDISGKVQNLQRIFTGGGKRFLKNGKIEGLFCLLPGQSKTGPVLLCEGYATGATLHEATGWPTVCAMNAGNLLAVGSVIRRRYPDRTIVVAADDDWPGERLGEAWAKVALTPETFQEAGITPEQLKEWTNPEKRITPPAKHREGLAQLLNLHRGQVGNPGIEKARAVIAAIGGVMAEPSFGGEDHGSDWNDYAVTQGIPAIRRHLEKVVQEFESARETETTDTLASPWDVYDPKYLTSKGKPLGNLPNFLSLLDHYGIQCRYNQITKEAEITVRGLTFRGDNAENAALAEVYSRAAETGYPVANIDTYLPRTALENQYNPVREWIEETPWDGTERLSLFLETITADPDFDEDFKNTLITKWLISAVAAAYSDEGFVCRGVLVLQGGQGIGKTSWFRNLTPHKNRWFGEGRILDPADKDSIYASISYWIVELGELEATFKKADLARLKAFVTNQSDKIRLPYGRRHSTFARRTVFAASVNSTNFLLDDTGNSRWWVIPCESITYDHGIDMQQLWAEIYACHYATRNEGHYLWWLTPEEEARLTQCNEDHEAGDPVEEAVLVLLDGLNHEAPRTQWEQKSATEILEMCDKVPVNRSNSTKAGMILRKRFGKAKKTHRGRMYFVPPKKDLYSL